MILIFLFTLIMFAVAYRYSIKNIKLNDAVDQMIVHLEKETQPELVIGETGFAFNGSIKICYELIKSDNPNGEFVVLLHGLTKTLLTYPFYFMDDFLKAGYHVVRLDNRDSGMSSWIKDWKNGHQYSLEDMVEDTMAVVDHLNIDQFHLVGKSMGGMIAQSLAIQHPAKVKSLISIMSTAYFHDPDLTQVPRQFALNFALAYIVYRFSSKQLKDLLKFHLRIEHFLSGENKEAIDQKLILQRTLYEKKHRNGFNKRAQKQHGYAIKKSGSRIEALKKLTTPTLVIHGKADPLVKFEHGQKCAEIIPQAQHLFVDQMGHRVPTIYSAPITKAIIQFWEMQKL